MTDEEFYQALSKIGHGERSFSVLRKAVANRPLAASEQIADQLEEDIAREFLRPGESLRETQLAERFGVSRGPIRDALRLLDADGLVRVHPNKGAVVSDYSATDLTHIAQLSRPITKFVLSQVVTNASPRTRTALSIAQVRIGNLLEARDFVAFALAVALLTMKEAGFAAGDFGERTLQLLYRPSIRYTIAGLGQANTAQAAVETWKAHRCAMDNGEVENACSLFLKLLRDIHLSVFN